MDDTDDDARYPPNPYGGNHQQGYGSSRRQKLPVRGVTYSREVGNQYVNDEDETDVDDDEDEVEFGEEEENNNQNNGIVPYVEKDVDDDDDDEDDEVEDHDNDDEYNEDDDGNREYVFMNPRAYLNRANGVDEMRDSPGHSESTAGEEDDSDGLPPKKRKIGRESDDRSSFRLLADSIHKFSEIYEKIENSKRQQMLELEKMRMDFHRDLEMQKRQIMERAQAEIAKIRQGLDDENDVSVENASG